MDIRNLFPQLNDAHAYLKHKDYSRALQIYVDLLTTLSEDSEEYSHVLLEYSQFLLENVMYQSEMNYRKLLQTRNPVDENEIEEDLENCWECLETCRIHFEALHNRQKLVEVHKGLGDVYCLQNSFEEGKGEYMTAADYCDGSADLVEIYECIADCYKNMNQYEEAIDHYKSAIELCEKFGMEAQAAELKELIEGISILKMQRDGVDEADSETDEDSGSDVPANVNHLRK